MSPSKVCRISLFLTFFCLFYPLQSPLYGADITVPRLELNTWGADRDGSFGLLTSAAADISINGGYKYGVLLGLSFEAANLGKALAYRNFDVKLLDTEDPATEVTPEDYNQLADRLNNQAVLSFRTFKATARDLFNLPLEFSFFAGMGDPFGSGEEFAQRYGIYDVETPFPGFYYFPEGIGGNPRRRYNGLYAVQGTGISFALTKSANFIPMLYFYHDFAVYDGKEMLYEEKPRYSGDFRMLLNTHLVQVDVYGGASMSKGEPVEVRGGILAFFRTEQGSEFLFQCGIPCFMINDKFNIDHIYLLFESRLKFNSWALHTTFFYHPVTYLHILEEKERGKADVNIKGLIGDPQEGGVSGGAEMTVGLKVYDMTDYYVKVSPFVSYTGSGFQWDLKIRIDPTSFDEPEKLVEIFMGVKTSY